MVTACPLGMWTISPGPAVTVSSPTETERRPSKTGTQLEKPEVHAALSSLLDRAARAEIKVPIDRAFSLDEIAKAHRYVEETSILGRVVVRP